MADTMRVIDGTNRCTVWRERRVTLIELADAVGLTDNDLAAIEGGGEAGPVVVDKVAAALDVPAGHAGAGQGRLLGWRALSSGTWSGFREHEASKASPPSAGANLAHTRKTVQ